MGSLYCRRSLSKALQARISSRILPAAPPVAGFNHRFRRRFHSTPVPWGIRSQILKDVGEGITEVQIIQWYVQEGARIEEWKPLCQYQSDKAVDDITSRYEGVIKKLHFQADDTVPTGMALCEIEVDDAKYPETNAPAPPKAESAPEPTTSASAVSEEKAQEVLAENSQAQVETAPAAPKSKYATFATPAVRGLLKEHGLDITKITGTGKDGRVMKEDVFKYLAERDSQAAAPAAQPTAATPSVDTPQVETPTRLTPIQSQMFKTMTKSLSVPHFLYADDLSISALASIRQKILSHPTEPQKISFLPFIIKAVSLALQQYPLLNARVDTTTNPDKPSLVMRSSHNIGVAMDTPTGLLVPNIKNVQARSILDIAAEVTRLAAVARAGKLTPADLNGGTITVSNIGTIGGTYVAPVLVPNEVAILGVGRSRTVPVFDEQGNVVKDQKMTFNWSADHRVIDGATMARMAEKVRMYVESPETMMLALR
ncbi:2-oxo acid dehydrogenases acyltransferase domain containing protein [Coccidioides posadasii C735 delta SOWgp]|uniref:Dihydrolipoamide acetyltransferase component of pyruvate dehydrogenase complex n=1 Tax=Coccidioides posadasii (strain C735) TaxID=222929 RepID=C5PG21_COCP7|nr:2-oxo acid dehydrogenases acyltransferase domain containing protein [Coccidioides posadasii C735 delta SOWgp]EER23474.1 2-oxo acid dehydrogenases acyltransferase domain containing protein [Coccidioides posadasii C735 delta SOWgp]|eukprot:XP_003065619.1 2-oxo acid dehydrogenases acyltransferase domain containing protein [Coccidioides posadasii C735 delta SOWgp]